MTSSLPVYEWARATPGDRHPPVTRVIAPDKIREYVEHERDENPRFAPASPELPTAVPVPLVRLYAPLLRRDLVAVLGYAYPDFATPAVSWQLDLRRSPSAGDTVHSVTSVGDKFEKRGRRFLEWHVDAWLDGGDPLLRFVYVNLWEPGRPEDKER